MEEKYNVVFTGELNAGADKASVVAAFCQRFNDNPDSFTNKLASGNPLTLKRGVTLDTAENVKVILAELGMVVEIQQAPALDVLPLEPVNTTEDAAPLQPTPPQSQASDTESHKNSSTELTNIVPEPTGSDDTTHKAASEKAIGFMQSSNPYEKVSRGNSYEEPEAELSEDDDGFTQFDGPVALDAGRGAAWITEGFSLHVKKDFGGWIGFMICYAILSIVVSLVPILGSLAMTLLGPVFTAGIMLGAKGQDEGHSFGVASLFSGFSNNVGQLVLAGILYLVGMIVILIAALALIGGSTLLALGTETPEAMSAMIANPLVTVLPFLIALLFVFPLLMAYWFAPALIALDNLSAIEAMKNSFMGSLKNILPMFVYSIVAMLLLFVASIPLFLGLFIFIPVMMASMYVAYKDIFHSQQ